MMIITLQRRVALKPEVSVHGDIVKVDLGAALIEIDKEGFKDFISDLITQAAGHEIYIRTLK